MQYFKKKEVDNLICVLLNSNIHYMAKSMHIHLCTFGLRLFEPVASHEGKSYCYSMQ